MPIMVERDKWILYKHTSSYELIKAVALDVKNSCASDVSELERYRMQERLAALNLYHTRNPKSKPLDSIHHRINTLEFFMFGYEDNRRFIFSPLGNLFLSHINDDEKIRKIFASMLFGIQFEHPGSKTPSCFQLYPFRLIFKLLMEKRLDSKLYSTEYAYIVAFTKTISPKDYDTVVDQILEFRNLSDENKVALLKEDEHACVNTTFEWQYMQKILSTLGILTIDRGDILGRLYHPPKTNSKSKPTDRKIRSGYATVASGMVPFVQKLLDNYSVFEKPLRIDDEERMRLDVIKQIYSFYPQILLEEIGEDTDELRLLELPRLIETYANNPDNETAYLFEDALEEGFNMFYNVEAKKFGGAGHTDIECLYLTRKKKFAIEAKSTANKLSGINAGRLRDHRDDIGGEYTIVITPRYVPAAKRDIRGNPIVIILASTFSEYLYNHLHHDVREIDYEDFDSIIRNNLGTDISKLISNMTMTKFAANSR